MKFILFCFRLAMTIGFDPSVPDIPVVELTGLHLGHTEAVNAVAWAPFSHHVCTVAEDKQVLIWGLENKDKPAEDPLLQYLAPTEINNVEWNGVHRDWVGICFDSHLQILKI